MARMVKVIADTTWVSQPGEMLIFDNVRLASIAYDPVPYIDEGEPIRTIVCYPEDRERILEAIEELDGVELLA